MTTAKKIEILNNQVNKLQINEASLNTFHRSSWNIETLEYIRVFFGEDSEPYKQCKQFNEALTEEHKTKIYTEGSAIWMARYDELLFMCIGILQHELYKKSKFTLLVKGLTIGVILTIIGFLITNAYNIGKYDGIKLGQSLLPIKDTGNNVTQQKTADSATNKPKQNNVHIDSAKADSIKK